MFDRIKPTHVIHLAAFVGGLFANMKMKVIGQLDVHYCLHVRNKLLGLILSLSNFLHTLTTQVEFWRLNVLMQDNIFQVCWA